LDPTAVVWVTKLATPIPPMPDVLTVGPGMQWFFRTGRYQSFTNPLKNEPKTGPAHSRLFVSLLRALGHPDRVWNPLSDGQRRIGHPHGGPAPGASRLTTGNSTSRGGVERGPEPCLRRPHGSRLRSSSIAAGP
jgi:hypothetical protein